MTEIGPRAHIEGPVYPNATRMIGSYHQAQLRILLDHVRAGFVRLDRGSIDAFELDEMLLHYRRSATELWKFCGSSGEERERAACVLEMMRERDEEPDWWELGTAPTAGA